MPLPVAHGILGASIVAASRPNLSLSRDWRPILLGGALAVVPDLDILFLWALGQDGEWHRSFSHSIVFALAAGLLVSMLRNSPQLKETLVFAAATASHGLLDTLTSKNAEGVKLLWPLAHRFKLGVFDYFDHPLDPNYTPLAEFFSEIFRVSLIELVIFTPVLLLALLINRSGSKALNEL